MNICPSLQIYKPQYLIVGIYILLPSALLSSERLPSILFYITTALTLCLLIKYRFAGGLTRIKKYWPLIASYGVSFVAVVFSSTVYGQWAGANSEGALRFFLGLLLLLLALPYIKQSLLKHSVWGLLIGGFISGLIIIWLSWTTHVRPDTPALILTTYSSITLLCAIISVFALKLRLTNSPRLEFILKIIAASTAFSGFIVAETRTGLLALPAFIIVSALLFTKTSQPLKILKFILISTIVLGAVILTNDGIRSRLHAVYNEAYACQEQNLPTSTCIRFQLWRAAFEAGKTHPWIGLGNGNHYNDYLVNVAFPKGLVAKETLEIYFGEPHNDIMLMFAAFGFPGALGLLLIYLTPCFYFLPRLAAKHDSNVRSAAAMGLVFCLGFAFFGLSETMFRRMNTIGFYVVFVSLFLVLSTSHSTTSSKKTLTTGKH